MRMAGTRRWSFALSRPLHGENVRCRKCADQQKPQVIHGISWTFGRGLIPQGSYACSTVGFTIIRQRAGPQPGGEGVTFLCGGFLAGRAFLPAIGLLSGGHYCPRSDPSPLGGQECPRSQTRDRQECPPHHKPPQSGDTPGGEAVCDSALHKWGGGDSRTFDQPIDSKNNAKAAAG